GRHLRVPHVVGAARVQIPLRRHSDRGHHLSRVGGRRKLRARTVGRALRRDPFNATVGRSLLQGLAMSPAIAGAALGIGAIAIVAGLAWPSDGGGTGDVLYNGGPAVALMSVIVNAVCLATIGLLFLLAWTHRRRVLWLGIIATIALGTF